MLRNKMLDDVPLSQEQDLTLLEEQMAKLEAEDLEDDEKWSLMDSTHHSQVHSLSPVQRSWVSPHKKMANMSLSPQKQPMVGSTVDFAHLNPRRKRTATHRQFTGFKLQTVKNPTEKPVFRSRLMRGTSASLTTSEDQVKQGITAECFAAYFTDSLEGAPLMSHRDDKRREVASLTKLMTAYTVLSLCKRFNMKTRQHYVPIHPKAANMEGTSACLRSGEEVLIIDLLYGLMLPSGNDAATALAQYFGKLMSFKLVNDNECHDNNSNLIEKWAEWREFYDNEYEGESVQLFIFEMNQITHQLGLKDTKFANPTGLTNKNSYSTAADMAKLTAICMNNHLLRQVVRRKAYRCEIKNEKMSYSREVIWKNTNRLLFKVRECIGVKTGITPGAGPCLSTAFRVGHREVVIIVLNCATLLDRYEDTEKIYRYARRMASASLYLQ